MSRFERMIAVAAAVWLVVAVFAALPAAAVGEREEKLAAAGELHGLHGLGHLVAKNGRLNEARIERLAGGLTKLTVPLRAGAPIARLLQAAEGGAKALHVMTATVDLFEPDLFADTVSMDVAPITEIDYNVGCVILNVDVPEQRKKLTITVKGPSPNTTASQNVTFDGSAFSLLWTSHEFTREGLHTVQCKVTGAAGKAKNKVCAGCT